MPKLRYIRAVGSMVYHVRANGLRWWKPSAACGANIKDPVPHEFDEKLGKKLRLCRKCRGLK